MRIVNGKTRKRALLTKLILLVLALASTVLYLTVFRHEWNTTVRYDSMNEIVYVATSPLNEGDIFIVVEKNERGHFPILRQDYLPGHYLMRLSGKAHRRKPDGLLNRYYRDERWEQLEVRIYNLLTKELERTIDVLEAFEKLDWEEMGDYRLLDWLGERLWSPTTFMKNGELYLVWNWIEFYQMELSHPDRERERRWIGLNYLTEEVALHEGRLIWMEGIGLPSEREREFHVCLSIFDDWSGLEEDLLLNNGIRRGYWSDFFIGAQPFPGVASVTSLASLLPEESESLYRRFPELRQFQGREDLEVQIILTDYPTAEEILEMFMEDGQEISFEGLVLRADSSIDGEEHEIHSFEDYMRLRSRSRWEVAE